MKTNQMKNPSPTPGNASAREEIARFLAGMSFDADKTAKAIHELAQEAPDELRKLRDVATADECREIAECLQDYAALGDQAPARMPDVHAHLQSCARCAADLSLLKQVAEQRAAWSDLSRTLRKAEQPSMLILLEQGWHWLTLKGSVLLSDLEVSIQAATDKLKELVPLSNIDVTRGRRMGSWSLLPMPTPSFKFRRDADQHLPTMPTPPSDATQPLVLSVNLPGNAAQIKITVEPKAKDATWHLCLEWEPTSSAAEVRVGYGNAEHQISGSRTLTAKNPSCVFDVDPPTREPYWLYFEWEFPGSESKSDRQELRLLSGMSGRKG